MAPNAEEFVHEPGFSFLPDHVFAALTFNFRAIKDMLFDPAYFPELENQGQDKNMDKPEMDKADDVMGDTYEVRKESIDEEHEVMAVDEQPEVIVIDDDSQHEGSDHDGEEDESEEDELMEDDEGEQMEMCISDDDEDAAVRVPDPNVLAFASALTRVVNSQMETLRCSLDGLLSVSQEQNMKHLKTDVRANRVKKITRVNNAVREQMEVDFRNTAKRIKVAILKKAMEELNDA
ncbi:uncharacterized protein L3040_002370 [Drepanopeziza brunnea f. sp. 'multigermtubi']|uniref:uncharacterized protein n=1 Tax=Drepanopeziza brunnea f. sp. 'multigermtubi' TaxID=698441 RepID=UPI0023881703|nr:hypothetical protein L3040_002370 [Drepanopeziza brunnea f. sp. 'multigermtubi']